MTGKLSPEQEKMCRQANLGGVFQNQSKIREISFRYQIDEKKIEYILKKYSTMETFLKEYRNGTLDNAGKAFLADNLNLKIEVCDKRNEDIRQLINEIYGEDSVVIYDESKVQEVLDLLRGKDRKIIEIFFRVPEGRKRHTLREASEEFGKTTEAVRKMKIEFLNKILRVLYKNEAILFQEFHGFETEEQKRERELIKDEIFHTELIFFPDNEIKENQRLRRSKQMKQLKLLFRKRSQITDDKQDTLPISDDIISLDLSTRTYNILVAGQITGIEQLRNMSEQELKNISRLGDKEIQEIEQVLGITYSKEIDNNPDSIRKEHFSVRTYNALRMVEITTFTQLRTSTREDLCKIRNLGVKGIQEIEQVLGITYSEEIDNNPDSIRKEHFSVRTYNALRRAEITTFSQLRSLTREDLCKIRNIGIRGIQEIEEKLEMLTEQQKDDEQSELEKLKDARQRLSKEAEELSRKTGEAKKLLETCYKLAGEDKEAKGKGE